MTADRTEAARPVDRLSRDTVARLRALHYPTRRWLGYFDHRWVDNQRRVIEANRVDEAVLTWIEDHLPDHVPDTRFPRSCDYDVCGEIELEGPACGWCGAGLDEDGTWHGELWPCRTAQILGLDVDAPPCDCPYSVWRRSRSDHDPDCLYAAWIAEVRT